MKPRSGLREELKLEAGLEEESDQEKGPCKRPHLAKVEARSHQEGQAGRASPWPAKEAQRKEQARSSNLGVREARPL